MNRENQARFHFIDRTATAIWATLVIGLLVALVVGWQEPVRSTVPLTQVRNQAPATLQVSTDQPPREPPQPVRRQLTEAEIKQAVEYGRTNPPGSIKGRVVFEGELPRLQPWVAQGTSKIDGSVCAKDSDIPNEQLIVHPEDRGVANAVVYFSKCPLGASNEYAHPGEIEVDIVGCQMTPHVVFGRTGDLFTIRNRDPVPHNLAFNTTKSDNAADCGPMRDFFQLKFKKPESIPFQVKCAIHPWIGGYWLILDHPYAAVTDEHGRFEISSIPPGKHQLRFWHEGLVRPASIDLTLEPSGVLDLGEVPLSEVGFGRPTKARSDPPSTSRAAEDSL